MWTTTHRSLRCGLFALLAACLTAAVIAVPAHAGVSLAVDSGKLSVTGGSDDDAITITDGLPTTAYVLSSVAVTSNSGCVKSNDQPNKNYYRCDGVDQVEVDMGIGEDYLDVKRDAAGPGAFGIVATGGKDTNLDILQDTSLAAVTSLFVMDATANGAPDRFVTGATTLVSYPLDGPAVGIDIEFPGGDGPPGEDDKIESHDGASFRLTNGDDTFGGDYELDHDEDVIALDGVDHVSPGAGRDRVFLGEGDDIVNVGGDDEPDYVDCGPGYDTVANSDVVDTLVNCEKFSNQGEGSNAPQCSDAIDNDADGVEDSEDPGCYHDGLYDPDDDVELQLYGFIAQCVDGKDNDNDGLKDVQDPGCYSNGKFNPTDDFELNIGASVPDCLDHEDNDGDGLVDFPADPGCTSFIDGSEQNTTTCGDGADNDGDGLSDSADPDCHTDGDPSNPNSYNPNGKETVPQGGGGSAGGGSGSATGTAAGASVPTATVASPPSDCDRLSSLGVTPTLSSPKGIGRGATLRVQGPARGVTLMSARSAVFTLKIKGKASSRIKSVSFNYGNGIARATDKKLPIRFELPRSAFRVGRYAVVARVKLVKPTRTVSLRSVIVMRNCLPATLGAFASSKRANAALSLDLRANTEGPLLKSVVFRPASALRGGFSSKLAGKRVGTLSLRAKKKTTRRVAVRLPKRLPRRGAAITLAKSGALKVVWKSNGHRIEVTGLPAGVDGAWLKLDRVGGKTPFRNPSRGVKLVHRVDLTDLHGTKVTVSRVTEVTRRGR